MAPVPSSVSVANGVTLSYAEQGDAAGPAIVLLPGPTDSWRSYEPVLAEVPLSIRTIAVSQRGHGDSDKPASGYRVEDFAADATSLLDALDVERAVLVAHSGSCMVARRVAIDDPDRVAGLVLEASPATLRGDAKLGELVDTVVTSLEDPIDPGFARSFVVDTSSDELADDVLDQLVAELSKVPARVWRETFGGLLQYDDRHDLGRITAATLLIRGTADRLVSRAMQLDLCERIPGAVLHEYAGAGHTPRWEEPRRFADDLVQVVEQVR